MEKDTLFTGLVEYARAEKILINEEEFKFQTQSHPNYPRLLAYVDTLTHLKIENVVGKTVADKLYLLPDSFIGKYDNKFQYITKKEDGYVVNGKRISSNELKNGWGEIVLIIKGKTEQITSPQYSNAKKLVIAFVIVFSLLVLASQFGPGKSLMLGLAILGLLFASEAIRQSLGLKGGFTSKLCNGLVSADCNSVINSNKTALLKRISLADISLVFFGFEIIALCLFNFVLNTGFFDFILSIGLYLTIPISLFSLYFQWKIEKKWCPVCMIILGVLYLQLITVNFFKPIGFINIKFSFIIITLGILLFVASIWYYGKRIISRINKLEKDQIINLRFRRNYELFRAGLDSMDKLIDSSIEDAMLFGNKNANLVIHIVTNPFCKYCEESHALIKRILDNHSADVCLALRFNRNPEFNSEENNLIFSNLIREYLEEGPSAFLSSMSYWFEFKEIDREIWKSKYVKKYDHYQIENILSAQWIWVTKNHLNFTPAFGIGNLPFPNTLYDRSDIEHFMIDLIDEANSFEELRTQKAN